MAVYECSNCGAELVTSKTSMTLTCAYCGRSISITDKSINNFRPKEVIPFKLDHKKAMEKFKEYATSSILTPKTFSNEHVIEKMQGLFVPFFLHSMKANSQAVVHGETHSSRRSGNDKITTVKVYEINLNSQGTFDDVPVDASKQMDNNLMDALEPFSYNERQNFNPAFMAGFFAEQPDEKVEETLPRAEEKIKTALNNEMLNKAGNFENKIIKNSSHNFTNKKSMYIMLPVWLLNVDYKGNKYVFAINGETGKIVGKLPMSKGKLFSICAGTFVVIQMISAVLLTIL